MAIPAVIEGAAQNYRFNSDFLLKTVKDLSAEEWLKRPEPNMNHVAWIVGHCAWARKALLSRMGTTWEKPWMDLFVRGSKLEADAVYPSPEELLAAWQESAGVLTAALENVPVELLAQPSTQGPRSTDGKVSGVVNFLAIHESYHIGQASYLRSWMGHKGLMG